MYLYLIYFNTTALAQKIWPPFERNHFYDNISVSQIIEMSGWQRSLLLLENQYQQKQTISIDSFYSHIFSIGSSFSQQRKWEKYEEIRKRRIFGSFFVEKILTGLCGSLLVKESKFGKAKFKRKNCVLVYISNLDQFFFVPSLKKSAIVL